MKIKDVIQLGTGGYFQPAPRFFTDPAALFATAKDYMNINGLSVYPAQMKSLHSGQPGWIQERAAWREQVAKLIRQAVTKAKRDGTTAVSTDCLWQMVRLPSAGGPVGTNAAWVARQAFNEIIAADPALYRFASLKNN